MFLTFWTYHAYISIFLFFQSGLFLQSMEDLIYELTGTRLPDTIPMIPMYIITNRIKHKGASAILNKKMLKEFGEKFHSDKVIVLPSSIHECILMPGTMIKNEYDLPYLTEMVSEVNCTDVAPHEQLSDRAYVLNL